MSAKQKKNTYTAAEVAALEDKIQQQQNEIDELKRRLEHMNEVFANAQRARFGQSSEKASYVLSADQISLFNEAEKEQDHKAAEPTPETFTVKAHARKQKRTLEEMTAELLRDPRRQTVNAKTKIGVAAGDVVIADFSQIDHSD